jgi:protein required for attachment to host cells
MKPAVTLYCVADEAGFRLLSGPPRAVPEELANVRAADLPGVDYEFGRTGGSRAGSVSFGHGTSAEIERPRLARHVVAALQAEWDKGRAARIVIAAGPKMLGALRDAMPKGLAAHVAAEVGKDLSDVPAHELRERLEGE